MKRVIFCIAILLMCLSLHAQTYSRYDVNHDGKITIDDASLVINALLGNSDQLIVNELLGGHDYVDLGLPSGTLWATCNLGASAPEGYGYYIQWGDTKQDEAKSYSDYMTSCKYATNTSCSKFSKYVTNSQYGTVDNLTRLEKSDDAANVLWGANWSMPSKAQIDELTNTENTTATWTTLNGVNGLKVVSKKNGHSLFLPACGTVGESGLAGSGEYAHYWSSELYSSMNDNAMNMFVGSSVDMFGSYYGLRCYGFSVRPVVSTQNFNDDYVDLGLPSGTLWAKHNIGATNPEDIGNYYAWGETASKSSYDWATYKYMQSGMTEWNYIDKYTIRDGNYYTSWYVLDDDDEDKSTFIGDSKTVLENDDDVARVMCGTEWSMPTQTQFKELLNNDYTTRTWTTVNGVKGRMVTSKINGNYIFLPASGYKNNTSLESSAGGYYWTKNLSSSQTTQAYYGGVYSSSDSYIYTTTRSYGLPVRPVKMK